MSAPLDRAEVERELAAAQDAHARAVRDLRNAHEQIDHSKQKHEEALGAGSATAATRRAVLDAQADLDSYVAIERRAEAALEKARTRMAQLERAESTTKYERARSAVVAFQSAVTDRAGVFVALDRQIDETVVTLARELAEALANYEEAERLASHLHMTGDLDRVARRPTVAQLRLEVTRAVTKARIDEQRDPLAPAWLAQADTHWKRAGLSAAELADHQAHEAAGQAAARDAELAQAAMLGRVAGANEATTIIHQENDT